MYICRATSQDHEIGERVDHVSRLQLPVNPDRQTFPCELVDSVQHAAFSAIIRPVFTKSDDQTWLGIFGRNWVQYSYLSDECPLFV